MRRVRGGLHRRRHRSALADGPRLARRARAATAKRAVRRGRAGAARRRSLGRAVLLSVGLGVGCASSPTPNEPRPDDASPAITASPLGATLPSEGAPDLAPAQLRVAPRGQGDGTRLADVDGCAECHTDAFAGWKASAHSFASFDDPVYRVAVERLRAERGKQASRMCAACHDIALLVDGAMDREVRPEDPRAHAGVSCRVCHGITAVRADGNGSFDLDPSPVPVPREGDPASARAHREAVARPVLREGELCLGCHRSFLDTATGNAHHLPGQDEAGAWRRSAYAGSHAARVDEVPERDCRSCHMPRVPAVAGDPGAKRGTLASHAFLGGHTWLADAQRDPELRAIVADFLKQSATIDIAGSDPGERRAGVRHRGADRDPPRRAPGGRRGRQERARRPPVPGRGARRAGHVARDRRDRRAGRAHARGRDAARGHGRGPHRAPTLRPRRGQPRTGAAPAGDPRLSRAGVRQHARPARRGDRALRADGPRGREPAADGPRDAAPPLPEPPAPARSLRRRDHAEGPGVRRGVPEEPRPRLRPLPAAARDYARSGLGGARRRGDRVSRAAARRARARARVGPRPLARAAGAPRPRAVSARARHRARADRAGARRRRGAAGGPRGQAGAAGGRLRRCAAGGGAGRAASRARPRASRGAARRLGVGRGRDTPRADSEARASGRHGVGHARGDARRRRRARASPRGGGAWPHPPAPRRRSPARPVARARRARRGASALRACTGQLSRATHSRRRPLRARALLRERASVRTGARSPPRERAPPRGALTRDSAIEARDPASRPRRQRYSRTRRRSFVSVTTFHAANAANSATSATAQRAFSGRSPSARIQAPSGTMLPVEAAMEASSPRCFGPAFANGTRRPENSRGGAKRPDSAPSGTCSSTQRSGCPTTGASLKLIDSKGRS
ncbi:MAG: hypothetical protein IPF92_20745 [Myxococcales bacterium]|nr:hypothetical protein [Myxococcales bacterium]